MIRLYCALIITFLSSPSMAFTWSNLWKTEDQQAQELMDKGQFSKAKDKFELEEWKAAAAYKSGDYQQAAELYKKAHTQQGYYNEGNALAHLGQYEQALDAYNKALALNPHDENARHNHKVISDLLKKDKEQQQNKEQQNKEQQNKEQQNKDQQNKDQQNKDQQNKDQQNKDQQNKDQQNKDQQNKDQQNKDQQNKDQQNKEQQNKEQQNKEQQNKEQQNKEQQKKEQQKKKGNKQQTEVQSQADKEKQQANEQWLRLIPDDPGGLLREKFLRDHLRRERGWYQ